MTTLVIALVVVLMLLGARLFVVVGLATLLCFSLILGTGADVDQLVRIVNKMEGLTTKNVFLSIPLFVGAGTVMTRGGMAARLIKLVRGLIGGVPGGLAVAAVVSSMIFAAISGSSPVTLVAVGTILYPALVESKFPRDATMGLLMTAGSLGCLLPPSIAMLIYAISVSGKAGVDPGDLFLAGFLPALGISGLLALYAVWVGLRNPASRTSTGTMPGPALLASLKEAGFALALPVIVVAGIYSGQFTPTEAGSVALAYAVIVCVFVHRELNWRGVYDAFAESAVLIGSLILIVVLAFGLNDFLAEVEAADRLGEWLRTANLSPAMFFLIVNVALVFIGALMDSVSATLVFAPLLAPIAIDVYGLDPVHFGVVFVVNMEIGYLMPPVATNLFVGAAIFRRPFGEVARAVFPTLAIVCVSLVVLMFVPTLSTGLLAWKNGRPVYQAFPWSGRASAVVDADDADDEAGRTPPTPSGGPGTPSQTAASPLSMEALMQQANQRNASADAGTKPLSMEELMKQADAAVAAGTPTTPPPPDVASDAGVSPPSMPSATTPTKVLTMEELMRQANEAVKKETPP
jgi:C4-dicarboxylate transporter DctM subunit